MHTFNKQKSKFHTFRHAYSFTHAIAYGQTIGNSKFSCIHTCILISMLIKTHQSWILQR